MPEQPAFDPGPIEGTVPTERAQRLIPFRARLPQPSLEYRSAFGRWLRRGEAVDEQAGHELTTHPWWKVIWLTGVDYFSTLGYQPGIALLAAGAVAPVATVILVLVTLLGALPVYAQVAGRSYAGQGSIAMLENLLAGWKGKALVLVLLGFAATDFVITMTLSAADAAQHAIENPFLGPVLGDHPVLVTLAILAVLAAVFLRGFKEAIGLATAAALPYLALNLVVLGRGAWEILTHPSLLGDWRSALDAKGDFTLVVAGALLVFPKLALGLSGFETGVSVMPLIDGGDADRGHDARKDGAPKGRVANTRRLLLTAAGIMSVMLLLSSFVTTLLIAPSDYEEGGKAAGRAIAFLAHKYMGPGFGTVYDVSTILILGLAGASAMAGLLHLIPRYLPRYGMAPQWATLSRPLVLALFGVNVVITLVFDADVEAQSGAYATGVLVLILSAAFAATLALWRERRWGMAFYSGILCLVFAYTLADNCLERPDGLDHRKHLHDPAPARERRQPVPAFGGVPHPPRVLQGRRELAHGAGAAGQEGAPGARRGLLGGDPAPEEGPDRPPLQGEGAVPVPPRQPARQPERVPGAARVDPPEGWRRLRRGGLRRSRDRQHHRVHQRVHGPHLDRPRAHPAGPDGAGRALPAVRRGRDGAHGVHHPPALLGLDPGGGRAPSHLPDERLASSRRVASMIAALASRLLRLTRGAAKVGGFHLEVLI